MDISLAPEIVFHLGPLAITNTMLTACIISILMAAFAVGMRMAMTKIPGRLQAGLELLYGWLIDTADGIIQHPRATKEVTPYILTLFMFVVISNWSGLLPGFSTLTVMGEHAGKTMAIPLFRAPTTDLNMTAALAIISIVYVQYLGLKYAGAKAYIGRFLNFRSPIGFFVGILELIGEAARVISFSFRLFGNVFAGEVLISVMFLLTMTLLPYVAILPLPFFFLELFVGIIQAFVFAFLTILFVSLAVVSHDSTGHTHGEEDEHVTEKLIYHNHPKRTA